MQLTTGTPTNNAINTRLSYKTKKFNFFSSINHQNRTYFGEGYYNKTTTENNVITSVLDRTTDSKRNYKSYSIYVGSDFYFNKKNTITLSYNYNNSDNNTNVDYQFKFFDTPDVLNTSFIATEIYNYLSQAIKTEPKAPPPNFFKTSHLLSNNFPSKLTSSAINLYINFKNYL